MYRKLQGELQERVAAVLRERYDVTLRTLAVGLPPKIEFGEMALPVAFELARRLRKAPRKIAEEIVAGLGSLEGFAAFEVAGAGYINARLDRAAAVRALASPPEQVETGRGEHVLVEHTSINPNKAAHVGHLRNAVLGDTLVRLLRATGHHVAVENYIDNTGVQVADIVVGLEWLLGLDRAGVAGRACGEGRADRLRLLGPVCADLAVVHGGDRGRQCRA